MQCFHFRQIEPKVGSGDDTSLNGVQLICGNIWGQADGSTAMSQPGPWGNWRGETRCAYGEVITGFKLQVEPPQVFCIKCYFIFKINSEMILKLKYCVATIT